MLSKTARPPAPQPQIVPPAAPGLRIVASTTTENATPTASTLVPDAASLLPRIAAVNAGALRLLAAHTHTVENVDTHAPMLAVSEEMHSNWDTGMQAITELQMRTGHASVPGMLRYVCSQQNKDGGWNDSPGDTVSGPTASLVNHAALVAYYRQCTESGAPDSALFRLVDDALKNSWRFWTGKVPSVDKLLDPLPMLKILKASPFGLMYYFNVFPPITNNLPFGKLLAGLVPSAHFVTSLLKKKGTMPQMKDFLTGAILRLAPQGSLGTKKMQGYRDELLETRGAGGMFCYLPLMTGLAVMALGRQAVNDPQMRSLIEESLDASRRNYVQGSDGVRVSTYLPDAFYAIDFIIARLLENPASVNAEETLRMLDYILATRATDGHFQQAYRQDEADDGLAFMTGKVLQLTGVLNAFAPLMTPETQGYLAKFNGLIPELGALLDKERNNNGGFGTFNRTELDKQPGAMKDMTYDTSSAATTATILLGLASVGQTTATSETMRQNVAWLLKDFKPNVGWWSRFGGGYLAGNATVIPALKAAGVDVTKDARVQQVITLMRQRQNPDGGWGEVSRLVDNPKLNANDIAMTGPSHPTLTAYGIMTMLDAGVAPADPALLQAVNYLLTQFHDPSAIVEKLSRDELVSFADIDQAGWASPYGTTTFSPPKMGWYAADETLGDLHPVLALQKYMMALAQSQPAGQ